MYAFFLVLSKADFQRRTNRFLGRGRGGISAQGQGFGAEAPSLEVSYPSSRGWRHFYVDVSLVEVWWYLFRSSALSRAKRAGKREPLSIFYSGDFLKFKVHFQHFQALELEISTHIMWTARDNYIFHQTRLKCTQNRNHGP